LGFLAAALIFGPAVANAQYLYTYTGADFDVFGQVGGPPQLVGPNPYTTSDHLTIQLTTSAPLAANMGTPVPGTPQLYGVALVSMTVSDGVQSARYTAADIANAATIPLSTSIAGYLVSNSTGKITSSGLDGITDTGNTHQFLWNSNNTPATSYSTPGDYTQDAVAPMSAYFFASSSGFGKWSFTVAPEIDPEFAAGIGAAIG
jgi:hypothetical protein